jgi:glycosyltransferase involved in cell wall biosynthesis
LETRGFKNLKLWTRGVDTSLFNPNLKEKLPYLGPIYLYVGRLSHEKGIDDFLSIDLPGTKLVIGDGPYKTVLESKYPKVVFLGFKHGTELAKYYASADVFVFPSKTDTFGLVQLEALSCGTPVAAFPVAGPKDVITSSDIGSLNDNLEKAIKKALKADRNKCREYALKNSWDECVDTIFRGKPVYF